MDVVRSMENFGAKDGSGTTSSRVTIINCGMVHKNKEDTAAMSPLSLLVLKPATSIKEIARAAAKVEFMKAAKEGCSDEEVKRRAAAAFKKAELAARAR